MADSNIDALSVFAPEHNQRHSVKSHVVNYWSQRAEDFAELHNEEFASDKHNQWLNEILPLLPHGHGLRILDVGTGSGFLALMLAEQGHMVSGIDLTPRMILEARHAARDLGLTVDFQVMDAENTTFEPETFDCIVTRNLTWTLPHLDQAYTHWYNLLKSGGCLINFDGDYCHERPLAELDLPEENAHSSIERSLMAEYEHIKEHLAGEQPARPDWDLQLLYNAGFRDIMLDQNVSDRIFANPDKFYNPTRMFIITAEK